MKCSTYQIVDILKFIFAICVVCIHSELFKGTELYEWVSPLFFRLAVPYFFIASGYFLGKKIYTDEKFNGFDKWWNYLKRLFQKLIVFEPISIILRFCIFLAAGLSLIEIGEKVIKSIIFYPWGALWYIQALIVAVFISIPFIKKGKEVPLLLISIFLYFIGLLGNRYYFLIDGTILGELMTSILEIIVSVRNGLFFGLVYVVLGLCIAKKQCFFNGIGSKTMYCFWGSYLLLISEVYLLRDLQGIDDNAMFLSAPLVITFLFLLSVNSSLPTLNFDTVVFRNFSTSIYLLHSPVLILLKYSYKFCMGDLIDSYSLTIICLIVLLFLISFIYSKRLLPFYDWIR